MGEHIALRAADAPAASSREVEIHRYEAGHGFNCDARASYSPEAAAVARERTLRFLVKHLK